jgi:hypothetical protein
VIERACIEDIAFRVIAANRRPDHCTIARFRQLNPTGRHRTGFMQQRPWRPAAAGEE